MKPLIVAISNESKAILVADRVVLADGFATRLFGLLGKRYLDPGAGLLIRPSSGIHTFGMRFPIDVIALDKTLKVIGAWPAVPPWRIRGLSVRTSSVLELAPGQIAATALEAGDQLCCRSSETGTVLQPGQRHLVEMENVYTEGAPG